MNLKLFICPRPPRIDWLTVTVLPGGAKPQRSPRPRDDELEGADEPEVGDEGVGELELGAWCVPLKQPT
jgi:hypothetical protein